MEPDDSEHIVIEPLRTQHEFADDVALWFIIGRRRIKIIQKVNREKRRSD
jgi:hypothetical protein